MSVINSDAFAIAFLASIYLGIIGYTAFCAKRVGRGPIVWGLAAAVLGLFAWGILIGISRAERREKSNSTAI
jgi:TM2 domain-containing membrane protein YozV